MGLDGQTNIYPAGFLGSEAAVAEYNQQGTQVWNALVNSAPASPVGSTMAKCAVDAAGNCYVSGWYQGNATFGANILKPQRTWNYFLAEVAIPSFAVPGVENAGQGSVLTAMPFPMNDMHITTLYNPTVIKNIGRDQNGSLILNLAGSPNASTRVWATTNLYTPNSWQPIFTNINTSTNGIWQFIDSNTAAYPTRFYRFSTP